MGTLSWQKSDCLKYFDKKTKVNKLKVNYARKRNIISRRVKFLLKKYFFYSIFIKNTYFNTIFVRIFIQENLKRKKTSSLVTLLSLKQKMC